MGEAKFSKEDLIEISRIFSSSIDAQINTAVENAFENYRKNYFVEPEIHYQDHLLLQSCRKTFIEKNQTHKLITDLNEKGQLIKAVNFANKLEKRESLIVKTATGVGVGSLVVGCIAYAKEFMGFVMSYIRSVPPQ